MRRAAVGMVASLTLVALACGGGPSTAKGPDGGAADGGGGRSDDASGGGGGGAGGGASSEDGAAGGDAAAVGDAPVESAAGDAGATTFRGWLEFQQRTTGRTFSGRFWPGTFDALGLASLAAYDRFLDDTQHAHGAAEDACREVDVKDSPVTPPSGDVGTTIDITSGAMPVVTLDRVNVGSILYSGSILPNAIVGQMGTLAFAGTNALTPDAVPDALPLGQPLSITAPAASASWSTSTPVTWTAPPTWPAGVDEVFYAQLGPSAGTGRSLVCRIKPAASTWTLGDADRAKLPATGLAFFRYYASQVVVIGGRTFRMSAATVRSQPFTR